MGTSVSKDLMTRWEERRKNILSASFSVELATDQQARISRARKDFAFFAETYFPHLCKSRCAKFQIDAANYLKSHPNTRAVFEWARGHAKSSMLSLMIPLWLLIQTPRQINLMLLVSKSEKAAIRLLGDLQAELEYNPLLIADFGRQVGNGSWAEGEFKTTGGVVFLAVGRGQTPRGIKERGQRPDYIVVDDVDDDELVLNHRRVGKVMDWCLTALIGTMAMGRGRYVLVGNRIGKDSVLTRHVERPNVYHTVVNAVDGKGRPSWPENYTAAEIADVRAFVGERRFQQEYMNNPIIEGSTFKEKDIHWGKILPLKEYRSLICYTDPSFKDSNKADYKATMLLGKTRDGYYHLLKAYAARTTVSAMVQWHYSIENWVDGRVPVLYFMESNFLQDMILDEFRKTGAERGQQIPVRGDMRKKKDKFFRIEALQPLFERGLVVFNQAERDSEGMRVLVEQLLMFERGSRVNDDAPDALEGGIFLLNRRTATTASKYACGQRPNRRY